MVNNVRYIGSNSLGELTVLIDGKRYTYENASPYLVEKCRMFIRKGYTGPLFSLLKTLSTKEKSHDSATSS